MKRTKPRRILHFILFIDENGNTIQSFELNENGKLLQPVEKVPLLQKIINNSSSSNLNQPQSCSSSTSIDQDSPIIKNNVSSLETLQFLTPLPFDSFYPHWEGDITDLSIDF